MHTETKFLKEQVHIEFSVFKKLKEHIELFAALLSGLLILTGWLLASNQMETSSVITYMAAYIIGGYAKAKEGIIDSITKKELNVELLMILAAIGSAIIGYWTEGAILIFIFAISGALESYTMRKSHKELSSLMELQPEVATIIKHGIERKVPVSELLIGDTIIIKPGERVPSDGTIIDGHTFIDEAAITGESIPVHKSLHTNVFAGTFNLRGTITVEITKPNSETLFQKIIELVQNAQSEKSPSQQYIEQFEGRYVKTVLIIVVLMMFVPHFALGWSWTETFYRAMILLVVASPCALVASVMPATLSAISNGARNGILVKGGAHLENLSRLKVIAFDKTGTLTKGEPEVVDVITREDLNEKQFLFHVASIEKYSNHPLASAIVKYTTDKEILLVKPEQMEDIAGNGVQATIEQKRWKVGKADFVGKEDAHKFNNQISSIYENEGKTVVFASDEDGIAGIITLKDTIRRETVSAIQALKKQGIIPVMLTGDSEKTASAIASESGIDIYIANCLPETKVDEIKKLNRKYGNVAMIGDGINDAPAIATATVGIAMGGGTDVALETADIVLMKNNLTKISKAINLSQKMNRIIKQNVYFSIAIILLLIASNFLQSLALPLGVIGHEGSTILVILNSLRLLRS
ncbi:heavy metal translocating P-type ATPase [Bacillus suaedaesalsae]|uniref:Cadmium-translocating P-type ATPase n=1 Tax=Bacillus suaedaesalsae TaxID=2810349 RepID=A0ABS2DG46_9BACI|nr:heavy metal translocating P-type ATPase [Bacillus suaedaesalsae]MBM6617449.1 cadmium-translocating P-type ATPase [Bacillus suaedaesalsae]